MPSFSAISCNAPAMSRAWPRLSMAQGPAIRVSGKSLPMVSSRTRMWCGWVIRSISGSFDDEQHVGLGVGLADLQDLLVLGRIVPAPGRGHVGELQQHHPVRLPVALALLVLAAAHQELA